MLLDLPEAANMTTGFEKVMKEDDDGNPVRAYGPFNSGNYVERTEKLKQDPDSKIPENATILYVGTYIDSTLVGNFGKESRKPLCVTLLNFRKTFVTDPESKEVICLPIEFTLNARYILVNLLVLH
jgi:hypothetical protein